ncbi:peptidoglycan-binding protein [Limobrevibacterium gyesilva]|uniref:Peptidoglycan-binding protein n=1 Tax=Limobrevibacterium gyesilva TaxID=2991712 RepID=A0AA42CD51_9PROT|nr:peptidoglycan-binding protein [Limobrevibacterium gyesilva]MCW3473269.1 peptidoglycan-binding protein [Limobrevibacterium gyesilva]
MPTAVDVIRQLAPKAKTNYVDAFADGDALLGQFGITTPLRSAHFLAQMLHETGGGTVLFESLYYTTPERLLQVFGEGQHSAAVRPGEVQGLLRNEPALAERVYGLGNPRKARELGNAQPGDGYRYRGGGVLQTTGRANYRRMGEKSGVDFEAQPDLVVDPAHALKPALHEWDEGQLNAAADRNDIRTITLKINGGTNGLDERKAWFDKLWALLRGGAAKTEAWAAAADDDSTRALQQALNDVGAAPKLDVDGLAGPSTEAAIRWFQQAAGLTVDGVAGEITWAALHQVLARTRVGSSPEAPQA